MPEQTPPAPIAAMIEATNAADSAAFIAAFTDDAYVRDGSREFTGHNGVSDWNRTDNIGVGMRFVLLSTQPAGDDTYVITIRAASSRFNGTGPMRITLRDNLIARLEIG
jgi:ketosteroid isomerase-like protein